MVRAAREAGATGIWANVLFLRRGTREHFLEALARDWPEQLPRYEELYANGRAYLPNEVTAPIRKQVAELATEHEVQHKKRRTLSPPAEPRQLALL